MKDMISPMMVRAIHELDSYQNLIEDHDGYETMMGLPLREIKTLTETQEDVDAQDGAK